MEGKNQNDIPKIRKAIFIVDKNRKYSFDVNQNITIHSLKKMLIAAANLSKVGLRIFHEGTEYTQNDDNALDYLFPNLDVVIFDLQVFAQEVDNYDEIIKLKFSTQYCSDPKHSGKYPYFYCRQCNKSFCSECLKDGIHNNHDYIEKYDYLQNSRQLTEKLFKDLTNGLEGTDEKLIMELKDRIKIKYFPSLVKMVKAIENKLNDLIDEFVRREHDNIMVVKNNMIALKQQCAEGLDELKDKICIEDMMIDEEIFLTFDKKFRGIADEKENILKNIDAYNLFKEQLKIIGDAVQRIYEEIYAFLEKYLTSDIYGNIMKEIDKVDVLPLNKKDIMIRLLSDIKKKPILFKKRPKVKKFEINYDYEDN